LISGFAFLSLVASVISIFLGLSVYLLNRKSLVNKIFLLVLVFNSYWAFSRFMMYQANDLETATLWTKILFLWPFLITLMVHFTLVFTESDLLKRKVTYAVLYLPAAAFSIIDLTTNLISSSPILEPWGYSETYPFGSWICHADGVWAAAMGVTVIALFISYYLRVSDETRKQQTKYVGLGFSIPVVISIIVDSAFPMLGIQFPSLGSISGALLSGFVAYAIWKYDLFTLNPAVAAENIVSTMPDSLVLVNPDGSILRVNQPLLDLLSYRENELIGKPLWQLFLEKDEGTKLLGELPLIREIRNREAKLLSKSGLEKAVSVSCSVVKDKRGQDVGVNCIIHDVTEQKEMGQRLLKAERYASIGELAGMIGHDLRNPLTSIRGAVYYLKAKHASSLDEKDKVMFETIEKSIDYSNKIVNDLLDYSTEIVLETEPANPKMLLTEARGIVSLPTNVKIVDITQEVPQIMVDKVKMTRVFVNIMRNAFDSMPEGGTLSVRSQLSNYCVLFSFADTGSGIAPEVMAKLWSPLFTTKAKGMGFGLAICKRIVEAHGGRIWAESIIGKGTIINVEIPLTPSPQVDTQWN
jgi:PAS domain S-box-containing protein